MKAIMLSDLDNYAAIARSWWESQQKQAPYQQPGQYSAPHFQQSQAHRGLHFSQYQPAGHISAQIPSQLNTNQFQAYHNVDYGTGQPNYATQYSQNGPEFSSKMQPSLFSGPRFRQIYHQNSGSLGKLLPFPSPSPALPATGGPHVPEEGDDRIAGAAQSPDINHPTSTNVERYMPLLIRKLNRTSAHSNAEYPVSPNTMDLENIDEDMQIEDPDLMVPPRKFPVPGGQEVETQEVPCQSPSCQTWITITIPEEGPIYPPLPRPGGPEAPGPGPERPGSSSVRGGPELPLRPIDPIPPIPTAPPKGLPPVPTGPKVVPHGQLRKGRPSWPSTNTSKPFGSTPPPHLGQLTTRNYSPDFVFSTSWILPLRQRSTTPVPAPPTPPPFTEAPAPSSRFTTETPPPGGAWQKPFTLKPRPRIPGISITTSTSSPSIIPVNRGIDLKEKTKKANKPWTHSSGGHNARPKSNKVPRNRPPPTAETSIEEAAIWVVDLVHIASTELIDAIREALERFRASLNRNAHNRDVAKEIGSQVQATWNQLKKGAWLERALAELALSDSGLQGNSTVDLEALKQTLDAELANAQPGHKQNTQMEDFRLPMADDVRNADARLESYDFEQNDDDAMIEPDHAVFETMID
ncbi:hypothetical protein DdX_08230 [Ditylenchus destructor]|uniref:Uncharacterized protein n=1 Tax=Ditylenchus destructor TaxID=166010 RepID=A0AAD4R792_9BILA|nr:hypothetical protein DdX_08230 [Ditylenchus destructor]